MPNYAKIDPTPSPHVIVDTQVLQPTDYMDPAFNWTDITSYSPLPQIGWTSTDDVVFTPPGLALDAYGYSVTMATVSSFDVYTNQIGIQGKVSHGSASTAAYLSIAIQMNLKLMAAAAEAFVQSRYSDSVRLNLIGLVMSCLNLTGLLSGTAVGVSLPNRMAYLYPLITWQNAILTYLAGYITTVQAMTNTATIASTTPSFTQFLPGGANADPLLTPVAAIAITT